jgi:frataxin-like iron-binding protein CyaY
MLLQDDCRVLSEPHQAQIGLRFPFLVIESKGGAAGGNLIVAQNQAAVDGACALNILADLERVAAQIKSQLDYCQSNQEDLMGRPGGEDKASMIVFSVTTEGPLHEIWVHFRVGDAYHMTCHRAWRTTRREDAKEFVQALARIVEWGKRGFRENILSLLGQIENAMLNGVSLRADESFSNETG